MKTTKCQKSEVKSQKSAKKRPGLTSYLRPLTSPIFCLVLLAALLPLALFAQSTVSVPLQLSVQMPVPVQTNYYWINPNSLPIVRLTNNVIDPAKGVRLEAFITSAAVFSLAPFPTNSYATLYVVNPGKLALFWPTNLVWFTAIPTNETRRILFFEAVEGEIWVSP